MTRSNGGGFWADFQKFLMRGNVLDLAVAVVIGGAFGKIITSLVEDIITPAILNPALKTAGVENLAALTVPGTAIKYGSFLAAVLSFIVIAFALFIIIRSFENARKRFFRRGEVVEETVAPDPAIVAQEKLTTALENLTHTIETRRTI
jgi:large conductance mechanosensitive channel